MASALKCRIPLAEAVHKANYLAKELEPFCTRIQIAGSIRRKAETVGDIELLCIAAKVPAGSDLFGDVTNERNLELDAVTDMVRRGMLSKRLDVNNRPCFGPLWQSVVFEGTAVDIFVCREPAQWGVSLAVRTGPAEFSKKLMMSKLVGGFLKPGQQVRDWRLSDRGVYLDTPEEIDVFEAIGKPYLMPEDRR